MLSCHKKRSQKNLAVEVRVKVVINRVKRVKSPQHILVKVHAIKSERAVEAIQKQRVFIIVDVAQRTLVLREKAKVDRLVVKVVDVLKLIISHHYEHQ